MCKMFNTDRVLIWIFIFENNGPDIEYINGEKNIVAYALPRYTINRNQETTQEYNYKNETVSEINNTKESTDGTFTMDLKLINHYQRKYSCLKSKYDMGMYHKGSFC